MAWQTDYCIMKKGMPILRGRKSVPRMNRSERKMERGYYSAFTCFENDENVDGGKKEDDMGACIKKLDKVGWAAQDPMYDTILLLFG
uniref:Nucleic acid-binding, OB-fold n=1 Tax=Tanacetum cinerariifolium TaxID=118510 RepID=A0A699GM08_TANCI|nr:nucleic acid-binding, OB-fold [Tanacetum cinerariifolium]